MTPTGPCGRPSALLRRGDDEAGVDVVGLRVDGRVPGAIRIDRDVAGRRRGFAGSSPNVIVCGVAGSSLPQSDRVSHVNHLDLVVEPHHRQGPRSAGRGRDLAVTDRHRISRTNGDCDRCRDSIGIHVRQHLPRILCRLTIVEALVCGRSSLKSERGRHRSCFRGAGTRA